MNMNIFLDTLKTNTSQKIEYGYIKIYIYTQMSWNTYHSGCSFNPSEKYESVKLYLFSPSRGQNKHALKNHHLDI